MISFAHVLNPGTGNDYSLIYSKVTVLLKFPAWRDW
jgi:hypothetical protein